MVCTSSELEKTPILAHDACSKSQIPSKTISRCDPKKKVASLYLDLFLFFPPLSAEDHRLFINKIFEDFEYSIVANTFYVREFNFFPIPRLDISLELLSASFVKRFNVMLFFFINVSEWVVFDVGERVYNCYQVVSSLDFVIYG